MKKIFFFLTVFFVLLSSPCLAGEWEPTDFCNQGCSEFDTESFANGYVLKAGGVANSVELSYCEIRNPQTGEWTPTDSMHFPRSGKDFLIRISDTEILATGQGGSNYTSEIYNLITGEWTITGNMHFGHKDHTTEAFESANGDTLFMVIGGDAVNDYKGCEIYNPATGEWTITGFLPSGKRLSPSRVLPNGNIISAAGGVTTYDQCAIYNPITGEWTEIAPLNQGHLDATMELHDGNPMIIAGVHGDTFENSCEVYNSQTNEWYFVDTLAIGRTGHCSKTLLNTKTLVMGGLSDQMGTNKSCELYNYETNQWQTATSTYYPYYNFSTKILLDERVLAIRSWCEIYTWNHMPEVSQPQALDGLNEALIGDILTFSVTVNDIDSDSASVQIDWGDGESTEWTELVPSGTTLQFSHSWNEVGQYYVRAQVADQWYFLNPLCHNSLSNWTEPTLITITGVGVEPDPHSPEPILCIYPNPFRTSTTISFSNSAQDQPGQNTEISVFNIKGQVVKTWSLNQTTSQQVVWNGKDDNGKNITSGIYFCKLISGEFFEIQRIVLLN